MKPRHLGLLAVVGLLALAVAPSAASNDEDRTPPLRPIQSGVVLSAYWTSTGALFEGYVKEGQQVRPGAFVQVLEGEMTGRVYHGWFVLQTLDATVVVPREKIIAIKFAAPQPAPANDGNATRRP